MRLDTRAFARAAGLTSGAAVLLVTLLLVMVGSHGEHTVLSAVWLGYSVSIPGAVIGALWAAAYGFLFGGVFAVLYNLINVPPAPPPFEWKPETRAKDR